MQLITYWWKKLTNKLNKNTIKTKKNILSERRWGALDHNILIKDPVVDLWTHNDGGWTLNVNNYTKCDVPSHIDWHLKAYGNQTTKEIYLYSQTIEKIYFLFWVVDTLYSFKTWIKVPGDYFDNDQQGRLISIYKFTDHGAVNSIDGIGSNYSREYISKGSKYKMELGNSWTPGTELLIIDEFQTHNDDSNSDVMLINFE